MATEVLIQGKPVQPAMDKVAETYQSEVVTDYTVE